jgi:hypothetical protein
MLLLLQLLLLRVRQPCCCPACLMAAALQPWCVRAASLRCLMLLLTQIPCWRCC